VSHRQSAEGRERARAKKAIGCPLCDAPPGRRCARRDRAWRWTPEIRKRDECRHVHAERVEAWRTAEAGGGEVDARGERRAGAE